MFLKKNVKCKEIKIEKNPINEIFINIGHETVEKYGKFIKGTETVFVKAYENIVFNMEKAYLKTQK